MCFRCRLHGDEKISQLCDDDGFWHCVNVGYANHVIGYRASESVIVSRVSANADERASVESVSGEESDRVCQEFECYFVFEKVFDFLECGLDVFQEGVRCAMLSGWVGLAVKCVHVIPQTLHLSHLPDNRAPKPCLASVDPVALLFERGFAFLENSYFSPKLHLKLLGRAFHVIEHALHFFAALRHAFGVFIQAAVSFR